MAFSKLQKGSDKTFRIVMETLVPIGLHGPLLKQKLMWGSVTTDGQREGEVLRVRRYWGVSPPRNAAYNRRPDWPQHQHKEIHHWLTLSAITLTSLSHTNIPMQMGQTHTHTADNGSPQTRLGGEKEMSGTHCKRGVHQSCQNNQLHHHSTSVLGCSGHWSSETHSGNMWTQLHRGWWKAQDYWEDKRERVLTSPFSASGSSSFSCA